MPVKTGPQPTFRDRLTGRISGSVAFHEQSKAVIPANGPVDLLGGPYSSEGETGFVILANAGIQKRENAIHGITLDSRVRGNDAVMCECRMAWFYCVLHSKWTGPNAGVQ
jgi:hypothetical protein